MYKKIASAFIKNGWSICRVALKLRAAWRDLQNSDFTYFVLDWTPEDTDDARHIGVGPHYTRTKH